MKNWEDIIREYEGGSLSGRAFCLQKGLNYTTFNYHKKKWTGMGSAGKFLAIQTGETPAGFLEVLYPNGVRLRLPATVRLADLKGLLDV